MTALVLAAFLLGSPREPILACRHDAKGELVVGVDQWNSIHEALDSWKLDRVLALVHPKKGMMERVVSADLVHREHLAIHWQTQTHGGLRESFRGVDRRDFFYDYWHPGYTLVAVSRLVPETPVNSKRFTRVGQMKGAMLYAVEPIWEGMSQRDRQELNRVSPITYIRMFCEDGRLWIRDIGSDWPAE